MMPLQPFFNFIISNKLRLSLFNVKIKTKTNSMKYRNSIYLSLASTLVMIILYVLSTFGLLGDSPVGRTSVDTEPLVVPAGYAFSIWGIIYLGLLVFPIYQLVQKRTGSENWHQVRILFSLNVVANGLWLAFASYNWLWMTVAVIIFMLITLYQINNLLIKIKAAGETINFWTERFVFSLYFAWVTVATALNISAALNYYDWSGFGLSDVTWSLIILPIVALIAGAVVWKYRDRGYAGVVVWAFIAIVVKRWDQYPMIAYLALGVALVFLAAMFLKKRQKIEAFSS